MVVEIRPAVESDVGVIASAMRPADVAECWAHGFDDPWEALQYSFTASSGECWTALLEGAPVAMFGATEVEPGVGSPWFLGTPATEAQSSHFVRQAWVFLPRWLDKWPVLMNYVDARNIVSIRWLRRIGFSLHDPHPHGARGYLFHRFELRR